MKATIFAMLCAVCMSISVDAGEISVNKVPAAVVKSFKAKFPKAENAIWEKERANVYEASFKENNIEHSVIFSKKGAWLATETEINVSELPENIRTVLAKKFSGFTTNEACTVTDTRHGNCYKAEVEKGKKTYDVLISADGKVLSKEVENDKDEDED
jgi:hypothetical protein